MVKDSRFDDIRPYYEEEIPDAMHRIADSDVFPLLASFVYPSDTIENVRNRLKKMCNGTLDITSNDEGITIVTITIPRSLKS